MSRSDFIFPEMIEYIKAPTRSSEMDSRSIESLVAGIVDDVRNRGDVAMHEYGVRFDKAELAAFEVTMEERQAALAGLTPQLRADTEFAIADVRRFAEAQLANMLPLEVELLPGVHLGHRVIPIKRVGCYVPGGRYSLLSAPIMTIVPAKVAGVDEVVTCLPPNAHQAMIAGCHLSGADRIFRIGGAQAIAAMAYGTQSVPAVDKIVGPGNAYVNEAKRQVFGAVGINQLAGPSGIYVIADTSGHAELIATDLLALPSTTCTPGSASLRPIGGVLRRRCGKSSASWIRSRPPRSLDLPGATMARSSFARTRRR